LEENCRWSGIGCGNNVIPQGRLVSTVVRTKNYEHKLMSGNFIFLYKTVLEFGILIITDNLFWLNVN
jgi:hypothetical protein